ncbi:MULTISPECIES: LacI family DNA-binding transcriptional regulator [unclassified Tenacibaculum]|uniref:LacI family DNA-binding transcriptional regulator n=1 Tax=unclassified Tenacibaculum TaxID=2635139 RepID=UPI001F31CD92|nr:MULTISPECIES: LacI family DNA-binding transcriptional regulator [unclassified Tenacibaculum]MCF2875026.1 LacI family transcriptional regulator [Tenacibaculum sp. Cn5-1]MCF2935102.1 LacI family transcriptional regulator [Tenacibaculum sp. Cn5-34]MCG7511456.1 LacI family transcriptional regulator [Tenacibaculum sp. Cn5-46]
MITLKDIAKELNISVSTVSKALNNSYEISQATIEKVQKLAKEYNYKPNKAALSLKKSKTKTIGVIIPDILNHFFAKSLHGIEKEASILGYSIITCISNELYKNEKKNIELLANGSVDGYIISVAEETQRKDEVEHFKAILRQQLPIVMFDRMIENVNCDKVIIDDFGAAYKATNQFLKEGRRKVALLSTLEGLNVGKLRTDGYLKAITESKTYKEKPIIVNIDTTVDLEEQVSKVFEEYDGVDGILAIDNTLGVIAINKAKDFGCKFPDDISIIGFSDKNVLPFCNPKLSTVTQHSEEIGKNAVRMIIERIEGKAPVERITKVINTSIELRETTKNR